MSSIMVKRMKDFDRDVRNDATAVFIDGYFKGLSFFSKNRNKLMKAFKNLLCEDVFYLAEMDGEVVGILACANNQQRAMPVKLSELKKGFGFFKGILAYMMLKREFNTPLAFSEDTAYIECVATTEKARGKGVSTALFQYVMWELPYHHYILEVVDTNQNAHRLYKKLGFEEFERKMEKYAKLKGFHARIYMRWSQQQSPCV